MIIYAETVQEAFWIYRQQEQYDGKLTAEHLFDNKWRVEPSTSYLLSAIRAS